MCTVPSTVPEEELLRSFFRGRTGSDRNPVTAAHVNALTDSTAAGSFFDTVEKQSQDRRQHSE